MGIWKSEYVEEGRQCFPLSVFSCPLMQHEQQFERYSDWLHISRTKHLLAHTLPCWWLWYDRGELASGWELVNDQMGRKKGDFPYVNIDATLNTAQ